VYLSCACNALHASKLVIQLRTAGSIQMLLGETFKDNHNQTPYGAPRLTVIDPLIMQPHQRQGPHLFSCVSAANEPRLPP
jgi:hypothetical protein